MALSSDTPLAGSFECSDAMLNRLHQTSTGRNVPTSSTSPPTAHNATRLGLDGRCEVYVRTATLNTDVEAFFSKWLVDVEDGQRGDGQFPWWPRSRWPATMAGRPGLMPDGLPLDDVPGLRRPTDPGNTLRR